MQKEGQMAPLEISYESAESLHSGLVAMPMVESGSDATMEREAEMRIQEMVSAFLKDMEDFFIHQARLRHDAAVADVRRAIEVEGRYNGKSVHAEDMNNTLVEVDLRTFSDEEECLERAAEMQSARVDIEAGDYVSLLSFFERLIRPESAYPVTAKNPNVSGKSNEARQLKSEIYNLIEPRERERSEESSLYALETFFDIEIEKNDKEDAKPGLLNARREFARGNVIAALELVEARLSEVAGGEYRRRLGQKDLANEAFFQSAVQEFTGGMIDFDEYRMVAREAWQEAYSHIREKDQPKKV